MATPDLYDALAALPRLADGAIAYPGRKIWRLHTTNGGRTWTTIPLTISTINRTGDIKCGDQSLWVTNPDLRHYGTREAAEADIPNHVVKPMYEAIKLCFSDGWVVEAIASEDEIFAACFTGPDSEERAREYARWKNDQ